MSIRKRVGVILSMNGSPYQGNFLKGFFSRMAEYNYDVLVFSALAKRGMGERHLTGELNIYSLVNFDMLDGIVVLPDTLPFDLDELEDYLDNISTCFKKPVVCVDYEDERFYNVSTSDVAGIERVVDHLIDEHSCSDILFVTGPDSHPHSIMRINGYRKSLEKHGIEYNSENIFFGSFWYETGDMIRDTLLSRDRLPDGIVCANDPMALSIIKMLEEEGYRIPDDIHIAGYDHDDDGSANPGCVTSCIRDVYSTGVKSADKMLQLLGKISEISDPEDRNKLIIEKSCGCYMKDYKTKPYLIKGADGSFKNFENINSEFNFMQEDMISKANVEEYMWNADWYMRGLEPFDSVSIFLNDNIFSREEDDDISDYTEKMIHIYTANRVNGKKSVDENRIISRTEICPELSKEHDEAMIYYFVPFHYYERCFGYISLRFRKENCVCNPNISRLVRNLNISFESLRRFVIYQRSQDNVVNLFKENIRLSTGMLETQEQLIIAFAEITESKSGQTGKHVKRVSEYSRVLGEALGLSSEKTEILRMASMMHDIGKLLVPSAILEKPGKLTDSEFDIVKTHVTEGERLLHNSPGEIMEAARIIALEHHEKWNGRGYLGKKGEEIDYNSRIVAVADVFDALVSKRSYKEPMELQKAYNIIISERGQHFSPEVVDAFSENFEKILEVLERHPDRMTL